MGLKRWSSLRQCGDPKIALFRSHLSEYTWYSFGTHIGQIFYKIF
jgi:hypothetical protein